MTTRTHPRNGKQVPEVEECVEVFNALPASVYLRIHQIIDWPVTRYKGWAEHYVFAGLTSTNAETLCAYLRQASFAHDRETTRRWTP